MDLDFTRDFRLNHDSPCPIQIRSSICNSVFDKNLPNISLQTSLDTECAFVPKKPIQSNTHEMKDFTETVKLYYGDLGQWFPKFGDITHFLNQIRPVPSTNILPPFFGANHYFGFHFSIALARSKNNKKEIN